MYCPNCATQIQNNEKFCIRCGTHLDTISDLLAGRVIEPPQSEEVIKLLERCHNGYLSTVIGLGLVTTALLIIIAAMMFGATTAAISSLIFLGWAIPAIAQGIGRWQSARRGIIAVLGDRSARNGEDQRQRSLPSGGSTIDAMGVAGSVTEATTGRLNQRA